MSSIDVSDDVAARLGAEADRRGLTVDQLLLRLTRDLAAEVSDTSAGRSLGFVALGSSVTGQQAKDADEMLADGFGRD